jgi:hypothetical protein
MNASGGLHALKSQRNDQFPRLGTFAFHQDIFNGVRSRSTAGSGLLKKASSNPRV